MDHIPQFIAPDHELPKVLYRGGSEPYDGNGFKKYPERRGWSLEALELGFRMGSAQALLETPRERVSGENSIQDPKEYAQLLQSWWYFGMLHEVLGESFRLEDFIQDSTVPGEQVVTTARLGKLLQAWWGQMRITNRDDALANLNKAQECINWVHQLLEIVGSRIEKFRVAPEHEFRQEVLSLSRHSETEKPIYSVGSFKDLETAYWRRAGRKLLPEHLELSICILGHTLFHAARSIYCKMELGDPDEFKPVPWYCPEFVYRRMAKNKFCPLEIERFKPSLQIIGGYLASSLKCRPERIDHSSCSKIRCEADNISKDNYERAHVCDKRDCPSGPSMTSREFQTVLDILKAGQVPVVRVHNEKSAEDLRLHIEVLSAETCSNYVAISHVWADGLGNVSDNTLYQCQWLRLQELAKKSFRVAMTGTSSSQDDLVPFWIDTFCVPQGEDMRWFRDIAIQRMATTYRNAYTVLVIENQLAFITEKMSHLEISMRISFCSWTRRLWTMHEGAVGKRIHIATRIGVIDTADITKFNYAAVKEDESYESESLIKGLGMIESMQLWARNLQIPAEGGSNLLFFAWNECRRRSTSVEIDRFLVMGIILSLDQDTLKILSRGPWQQPELVTVEEKRLEEEKRIKTILIAFDKIPPGIVFTEGNRMAEPGWGWAPNTMNLPIPFSSSPPATRDQKGLYVSSAGVHLISHPDWTRKFDISGVFTEIDSSDQPLSSSRCAFCVKISGEELSSEEIYTANVAPASWDSDSVVSNANLALVIHSESKGSRIWQRAILVSCVEEVDDVIYCRNLCQMHWIKPQTESIALLMSGLEEGLYEAVKGTWCANGSGQRWCIG